MRGFGRGPMTANPVSEPSSVHYSRYDMVGRIRRRIFVSIAAGVGWISFVLLYLAFYAQQFTIFQDVVLIIVSLLVLAGVLMGAWISFGLRFVDHWSDW
jgi:hypothetical protein